MKCFVHRHLSKYYIYEMTVLIEKPKIKKFNFSFFGCFIIKMK